MQENTNMLSTKQRSLLSFRFLLARTRNMEVHLALSLLALIVTGMIKDVTVARMLWHFLKRMQKRLLRKRKRRRIQQKAQRERFKPRTHHQEMGHPKRSIQRRRQILDLQGACKKPKPSPKLLLDRMTTSKRTKKRRKSQKWSKKLYHKIDNVKVATNISLHLKSKRNMDFANSIRSLVK